MRKRRIRLFRWLKFLKIPLHVSHFLLLTEHDALANYAVILAAAGKSSRFRDPHYKKPFISLEGRPVWLHATEKFLARDDVKQCIVVVSPEDEAYFRERFEANIAMLGLDLVLGGAERADSVANALEVVGEQIDYIAVHDAARPCLAIEWIDKIFAAAEASGAAIPAIPVTGTLKKVDAQRQVSETVSREHLWEAQTPQVFRRDLLEKAYAQRGGMAVTDEAQAVERMGHKVSIVVGSPLNLKITTKEDLKLASHALKSLPQPKIFGSGNPFDNDDMWR